MADISDVENQMISLIADFLGMGEHYLPGTVAGSPVAKTRIRLYRGWPAAGTMDKDLAEGISNVTVFPVAGATRRTTEYFNQWREKYRIPPTFTAVIEDRDVIFGGTASDRHMVGIQFGDTPSSPNAYALRLTKTDTPESVAAAFGALIPQTTVTGPIITLPSSANLYIHVAVDHSMWMEVRRQEQQVWVTTWCSSPEIRDVVTKAVDGGFAGLMTEEGNLTDQFELPDGSSARLLYISSHTDDVPQRQELWRRDLRYVVSYPTTITKEFPEMIFGKVITTEEISKKINITVVGSVAD